MKETKILYRGISLTGSFSPETLEWLNIYNSLPKELQDAVNFEPEELTRAMMQYNNMLTRNTPDTVYDAGQYDPAGGLVFNPEFWNDKNAIEHANCYAHAMNVYVQTPRARLQPGKIAQMPVDIRQPILQVANNLIRAVERDISIGMGRIVKLRPCTYDIPQGEEYKVAFVVAPEASNADRIFDYHWYRENKNGVWSHKPGLTDATTEDHSKKTIDASNKPEQCDRNYNKNLNYSIFCGYYMVTYVPYRRW